MKHITPLGIALFTTCIITRTLLAYTAYVVQTKYLQLMGVFAIGPAIGFLYFFISGARTTGAEVMGDYIWWNNLRPIHALLYAIFAYSAIYKYQYSWMFLTADVCIGLIAFIINRIIPLV